MTSDLSLEPVNERTQIDTFAIDTLVRQAEIERTSGLTQSAVLSIPH